MFFMVREFGAGITCTWNPSDKTADMSLANGNLDAIDLGSSTSEGVRATLSLTTGLKYLELELIDTRVVDDIFIGFCRAAFPFTGATNGNCHMAWRGGGNIFADGAYQNTNANLGSLQYPYAIGDRMCLAADLSNGNVWLRVNNGAWIGTSADPDTLTAPTCSTTNMTTAANFPVHFTDNCPTDSYNVRIHAHASLLAYAMPTSFSAWGD